MTYRMSAFLAAAYALFVCVPHSAYAIELYQGSYVSGTENYAYGHNSIPSIPVTGAPKDTDWNRWAMLHDGSTYRLYAFQSGSRTTFYQFGFNISSGTYEFGYQSIPVLTLSGVPASASTQQFAMLHDGTTYRLYLQDQNDRTVLHQFGFNPRSETYEYGNNSIATLRIIGMPRDTDWRRWALLHDGSDYRFYAFQQGSNRNFYQAAYDSSKQKYVFGYRSIPQLALNGFPSGIGTENFAMLHDRDAYRFYFND